MKKQITYLKYFFYIAINWNIKIAWHILKQEIRGEKKYGINSTGQDELHVLEAKGIDTEHSTIYMPVSYELLEIIFQQINPLTNKPTNHFLDIGCGKGRSLCVAAHNGFTQLTGIDFSKEFCQEANSNLEITKKIFPEMNFNIFNNDAFYFEIPVDVNYIFMFNPFDEFIMRGVAKNIQKSFRSNHRTITLIYVNPLHQDIFFKMGFKQIFHFKKMEYLEVMMAQLQ